MTYYRNKYDIYIHVYSTIYYYRMKKYVSKEDVEKGLVDPKKPLKEQKDYLDKMEKAEQ